MKTLIGSNYYVVCVVSGAYELPRAAKEHETQCHRNPNYIIRHMRNLALSVSITIEFIGTFLIFQSVRGHLTSVGEKYASLSPLSSMASIMRFLFPYKETTI